MNSDDIQARMQLIANDADFGSVYDAHREEDRLYHDFVKAIANSDSRWAPLAALVVQSETLDFTRHYEEWEGYWG